MFRAVFIVPTAALMLGGCLSSGSNPNCRVTVLPEQGSFQMCSVGNVILMEPAGGTYVTQAPSPEAEVAADPTPEEPALEIDPTSGESSLGEDEPVVIN